MAGLAALLDPASFVFLDETGATTNMVRRYGWAPKGERLVDAAPFGHWCTTTFVAGLRSSGIISPLVLDGPMDGEAFRAYVEQVLAPSLLPGDVVVMDNLAAHKVADVHEAVAAVGASILYLPPKAPTSIRLSRCSPGSKRFSAKPLPDHATRSGTRSASSFTVSAQPNAATTSRTQAMRRVKCECPSRCPDGFPQRANF